eukprot:TRINITY_DN21021_c3_g3_i1.p1 TRINITY_DN21021_c3_g3~~TRINITY_DN21021_c3_g3_i1.p1  ORF type:complete len:169 (+),score=19.17 TRINITY_DN21021_c3_g3_i1:78-509(+)
MARPDTPFFFFTTPPKRRVQNESEDLYTAQLTPGAMLHLGLEGPQAAIPAAAAAAGTPDIAATFLRPEVAALFNLHLHPSADPNNDAADPPEGSATHAEGGEDGGSKAGGAAGAGSAVNDKQGASGVKAKGGAAMAKPKWFKR